MKKILIVNNDLKTGGVQKSLIDLLKEIHNSYDITLLLFQNKKEYENLIPKDVKIIETKSQFKHFGMSKQDTKGKPFLYLGRAFWFVICKLFGRSAVASLMSVFQKKLSGFDVAVSFLHEHDQKILYGGCNEFVLKNVKANKKITWLHCDFMLSGANNARSRKIYDQFDVIAACSDGCKKSFLKALPHLEPRTQTVINCHDFEGIRALAEENPIIYDDKYINVIIVARLSAEKGIERALYALKNALDKNTSAKLHIVGGGILMDALQKMCRELNIENNVVFYGSQTNPYRYIKNADVLFIPSYHEAAPLVIDEAVCLGVPVLSTATTSSEDMILNRNIGWVCENNQTSINEVFFDIISSKDEILEKKKAIENRGPANNKIALEMIEKLIAE